MLITEFRIPMPLTLSEYERGQLFSCMEASKNESKKGVGVEILISEPFDNYPLLGDRFNRGHYTKKVYYIGSRLPKFIATLAPRSALTVYEESWNAYPYCRTIVTNKRMGSDFFVQIDTYHVDESRGDAENVHQLNEEKLNKREVVLMDIGNDPLPSDWSLEEDPSTFRSTKTRRGPLTGNWIQTAYPIMTCYKLVTAQFKWFGLQGAVEKFIMKTEAKLFLKFHKQVFCWIDLWIDISMPQIRRLEQEAKDELFRLLREGSSFAASSHHNVAAARSISRFRT